MLAEFDHLFWPSRPALGQKTESCTQGTQPEFEQIVILNLCHAAPARDTKTCEDMREGKRELPFIKDLFMKSEEYLVVSVSIA